MSKKKPSNPALFDTAAEYDVGTDLTLRDLFAAAALSRLPHDCWSIEEAVEAAGITADLMLAERERGAGDGESE